MRFVVFPICDFRFRIVNMAQFKLIESVSIRGLNENGGKPEGLPPSWISPLPNRWGEGVRRTGEGTL
jgi:hypothetical protein